MKAVYYTAFVCSVIALILYFILSIDWLFAIALILVVLSGTLRRKQSKSDE